MAGAQAGAPVLAHAPVRTRLESPWDIAFLPDGTMFFTEKCHGLSVRQASGTVVKLLGMKDAKGYASTVNDLFCEGQAGMAGVAVDPSFASNRCIYVYSTSSLSAPGSNRVMRLKVNDGFLYLTTGDTHNGEVPQSPTCIGGKVLRVDRDGKAAPGNGAPAGFDPRVYTDGHRNPQGISFRPGTNQPRGSRPAGVDAWGPRVPTRL